MTITLRELVRDDAPWLDAWLPSVADAVGYAHRDAGALVGGNRNRRLHARIIVRDGIAVGIAAYRTLPGDASIIELIATPPEHARKGAGMMAASLVEDELRQGGTATVFAPAPAAHGIAMYFWIRLGYAPVLRADWPCNLDGVAWLRRTITRG